MNSCKFYIPIFILLIIAAAGYPVSVYAHGKEKHQEQTKVVIEEVEKTVETVPGIVSTEGRLSKIMDFLEINLPVYLGISALSSLLITFLIGFPGHRRIIKFNLKLHNFCVFNGRPGIESRYMDADRTFF